MESTTPTNKRKQSATCETCDVMFSNEQDLYAHFLTKDHMMASTEATELRRPFCVHDPSQAVYVRGLSLRNSLHDLQDVFRPYGEIKQLILTKVSKYEAGCLVEYAEVGAVDAVLKKSPLLNGTKLHVKKYSIRSSLVSHETSIASQSSNKKVCTESDDVRPSSSRSSSLPETTPPLERNGTAKDTSSSQLSTSKKKEPAQLSPAEKLLKIFEHQNTPKELEDDRSCSVSPLNHTNIVQNTSRASLQDSPHKESPRLKIDDKMYDDQIIDFVTQLQATLPLVQYKYQEVFEDVRRAIGLLNVKYNCYLFGSSFTGLCWDGSDLDICIQWGRVVRDLELVLNDCRKVLYKSGCFDKVIIIRARTPLIRAQHKKFKLQCDISFKSRLGVYNSILIKILLLFDARLQTMIMFLKYWGQKNELVGSNKMNSYCLCWMIIFFLQVQNILPTIEFLNSFSPEHMQYMGWNVSFFNIPHVTVSEIREQFLLQNPYQEKSIRQLLIEFFDYYLTFDYGKNVICPIIGTTIPRTNFENLTDLPPSMVQFVREAQTLRMSRTNDFMFDRSFVFCLQDPIELTFNIGKCMSPKLKDHFKLCCKTATQILVTEKVYMIVPKLTQGQDSKEPEGNAYVMTGQKQVSMTVDQTLKMLKKSYCHTIGVEQSELHTDPHLWITDLFMALIMVLNKCWQFDISVCSKNQCTDEVINKKYLQFGKKLNLNWCQILYCKGSSVLFHNRKKLKKEMKSILLPNKLKNKSEFEKEIYQYTKIFQKEMSSKSSEQQSKEQFFLVFFFNPIDRVTRVEVTFMRYFKPNSIPGVNNYHAFFEYAHQNFLPLIYRSLSFVRNNRGKLDLSVELKSICDDYLNLLIPPPPSPRSVHNLSGSTVSSQSDFVQEGQSNSQATLEDVTDIVKEQQSKETHEKIKSEPSSANPADSDSDIEIVPVEPKVFECIDVE
ncbi:uncharacterized protein [Bemisia tabaci]|uniref:uncharacterized protein isoform X2 n=1 Tax=Bemisia tabaci TaxID=7038 RepID=UPI003B289737